MDCHALRLVRRRPALRPLSRRRVGRAGARRPASVRDADPRGRAGRPELDHDSPQAPGVPAARSIASIRARSRATTRARSARSSPNPGIVRNRLKIAGAVKNARAFLAVQKEFGSFDAYVWRFVGGQPKVNRPRSLKDVRRDDAGIRRAQQGPQEARLHVRRVDDLLRVHAGCRHGGRSRRGCMAARLAIDSRRRHATRSPETASGLRGQPLLCVAHGSECRVLRECRVPLEGHPPYHSNPASRLGLRTPIVC